MAEYIEREAVNALIEAECSPKVAAFLNHAIDNIPAADVVPVGLLEQVEWERDIALAQLAEIGKSLGEKMDDVRPVPDGGIGEMSDGYHTFNGLYYQRMVLFAALVKAHKDKAWKSLRHEDGELCFGGGWFIVGIDTPQGSYTYHYEDKDWNRFDCVELPVAKHWDGHTEEDVTRLLSLDAQPVVRGTWDTDGRSTGTDGGADMREES